MKPAQRLTEAAAAKSFAKAGKDLPASALASASGRHLEAAKLWKAGKRCPNGSSLINMARHFTAVALWLLNQLTAGRN